MALNHINCWKPDTCGCEIHYAFDDTLPPDQVVHVPVFDPYVDTNGNERQTTVCPFHTGIGAVPALHDNVLAENRTKNIFEAALLKNYPNLAGKYLLAFTGADANRTLQVTLPVAAVLPTDLTAIQNLTQGLSKPVSIVTQ